MVDPVQILWSPAGESMPSLGSDALVDVHDGDTPNIRMPVRMLSVDTPEVTAKSAAGAANVDEKFKELAGWIEQGKAPISKELAEFLLPKIRTGHAGTLQFEQGTKAAQFNTDNINKRLTEGVPEGKPPHAKPRRIFIRTADSPFDDHHRLLAYVAPDYSKEERAALTRRQRSTFNFDLIESGWAATFIIYPSIPGELDLPMTLEAAEKAVKGKKGIWKEPATLLGYEYRALERLHEVTRKIVDGTPLRPGESFSWRERYCADLRTRELFGPEDYFKVPPVYRLWFWPKDVNEAIGRLNLVPSRELGGGRRGGGR
ncbi:nuclease [Streptomyces mobaraensis NBRC 13819 = DSM 40847]|uniref:Nuclease n=1 Tax=Streptomyces mobaraensis (strain ATCC 29032 / DSM 40847 / JCM 4168 / NBRC 13819 / NCIMB 11159 / IPCR 16-22) TaxID=1223523 RepID=M3A6E9_STRM1|nr:thermonuclease family protein [Streptomyces mobaraensis]EMF00719.1 nuclease [Streptomyces mobaraensis NBRC 13819 = DSM 40847]QTT72564.1 nuclease [Streptomyces mobaraensis NBRC 13819 = DSM 40847]